MWTFFLGLFLGVLLGLNYKLVINQLSRLLGIPEKELLEIHGEAPKSAIPEPSKPSLPLTAQKSSKAQKEDEVDLESNGAKEKEQKAPSEEKAEEAPKESEAESKEDNSKEPSEIEAGKEVCISKDVKKEQEEAPEPLPKMVDLELEVLLPNWVDFPLRRPQIQFQFQSENGEHSFTELLELGEKGAVQLEPETQYNLKAKMIRMSTMVKPFNWSGRFNPSTVFSVGRERMKVTYLTPRTLRDRANLKLEVIAAVP